MTEESALSKNVIMYQEFNFSQFLMHVQRIYINVLYISPQRMPDLRDILPDPSKKKKKKFMMMKT